MTYTRTHTHVWWPFSGNTQVSRYQKGKTSLDFTEAKDNEWQWHQLGHVQDCTLLQTDNHATTLPLSFLQAGCLPAAQPTASKHWRHKWHNVVRTHLLQYLHNKTFRINHPYPLNSILLCGAFFMHCRHQQVCYADGSLAHTATQTPAARNTQ